MQAYIHEDPVLDESFLVSAKNKFDCMNFNSLIAYRPFILLDVL